MFIEERHQQILESIAANGRISIGEIQERFDVSVDSARRDLRILEEKGLLKRTHGGAIPLPQVDSRPPRDRDFAEMEIYDNYAAIAKAGVGYIRANDCVYLTSGSFGFIMLKYLPRDIPYTLVVNSVSLANDLKMWDNIAVYVTGGKMRMHTAASLVDSFATTFVKNLHFDLALMTGAGLEAAFGLSNGTDETATFQRTVITNARRKVLMLPNQKIGFKAFVKVCDTSAFDVLLTDWDAPEDELARIEEAGVRVVVAEKVDM